MTLGAPSSVSILTAAQAEGAKSTASAPLWRVWSAGDRPVGQIYKNTERKFGLEVSWSLGVRSCCDVVQVCLWVHHRPASSVSILEQATAPVLQPRIIPDYMTQARPPAGAPRSSLSASLWQNTPRSPAGTPPAGMASAHSAVNGRFCDRVKTKATHAPI